MKKIIDWAKRHLILSIVFAFTAPLVIIHILFLIPAPWSFLASQWEAGDIIAYCAGFMAFSGTVFLGVTANKQNAKLMELQAQESLRLRSCNIYLSDASETHTQQEVTTLSDEFGNDGDNCSSGVLYINILNTSCAFLSEICIYHDKFYFSSHIALTENMTKCICVPVAAIGITYTIEFVSCYGERTYGDFLVDSGFDEERDWSRDREITDKPYIKHYHFYGTIPPKSIK